MMPDSTLTLTPSESSHRCCPARCVSAVGYYISPHLSRPPFSLMVGVRRTDALALAETEGSKPNSPICSCGSGMIPQTRSY